MTKLLEIEYTAEDFSKEQMEVFFDSIVRNHNNGDLAALKSQIDNIDIRINYYNKDGYEDVRYFNFKNDMIPEFVMEDLQQKAMEIGAISR